MVEPADGLLIDENLKLELTPKEATNGVQEIYEDPDAGTYLQPIY